MKNSYIPEIFKVKIAKSISFLHSLIYFFMCIFFCLSLISFNFNDNSFISNTSLPTENYLGNLGAYTSSFIFYTFGYMGYGIVLFFLIISFLGFYRKQVKYFFIRLLVLFISLILIPQTLIRLNIEIRFYNELPSWGSFALILNSYFHKDFFNYVSTILGTILFIVSTNLFVLLKLPKINFSKFKIDKKIINNKPIKKEPVIKQMNISSNEVPKLLEEANNLLKNNEAEQAKKIYETLIGMDPGNSKIIVGLLRSLMQLQKYEEAKEIVNSVDDTILQNEEVSKILKLLENFGNNNNQSKLDELRERLDSNPNDHKLRFELAEIYLKANETEKGFQELLHIFDQNQKWNEEAAKKKLLEYFDLLGFNDPNVINARKKLSSMMFK